MAESFVKTHKRDYLAFINLESAETALSSQPGAIASTFCPRLLIEKQGGLSDPETRQEESICLIPGFMLTQETNGLKERGINVW